MTSTLAATLHVSLRRARAAWPIVGAAALITVLAATLLAAGPMYASAVSLAGLQRVLADAPVADANIEVAARTDAARAAAADRTVTAELERALGATGGTILRSGRSDTFTAPVAVSGPLVDLVEIGFADGIERHATLDAGSWPSALPVPIGAEGPVPVAVATAVAERLGLEVGDRWTLESRIRPGELVTVEVVGRYRVDAPGHPFWWGDEQATEGLVLSDRFATHGPFITSPEQFRERVAPAGGRYAWRAMPDIGALTLPAAERLRAAVGGLAARITAVPEVASVSVVSGLPEIVEATRRSILASRSSVLVLVSQFVILAAYAVLLSAALLVDHRRRDTAMLRSRGAGPGQVAAMALVEGLAITVPAALVAPWLAAIAIRVLARVGPLAGIELAIDPVVSVEAYVAAAIGAGICLLALMVPALPRIRSFTAIHGGIGRTETRTAGHRFGLDIALLAVAAIGLWQLRQYGAPLTATVQGAIGIDPLLVATPAIGFLAGAVLALRLVPLVAEVLERVTHRRRGVVSSLGARQLARRPLRYTRSALLLMLAVAMGVFAIAYTGTWTASQRDQAAYQVGADVRVEPGRGAADRPRDELERAYAALPGVAARSPIDREPVTLVRSERPGEIVGLDPAAAGTVVRLRSDLAPGPLGELLAPLGEGRPDLALVELPEGAQAVRVAIDLELVQLQEPRFDPDAGETVLAELDPAAIADRPGLTPAVVVLDAAGHLWRYVGTTVPLGGGPHAVEIALGSRTSPSSGPDAAATSLAGPLRLLGIEVAVRLPEATIAPLATVAVAGVEVGRDGAWADLPIGLDGGWRATASIHGAPLQPVAGGLTGDALAVATGGEGLAALPGVDDVGRGTTIGFGPAELERLLAAPIPAVATDAFLAATAAAVGDIVPLRIAGTAREVRIAGAIRAFPTVAPDRALLVMDHATLGLARYHGSAAVEPAEQWWLAVDEGARTDVVERLRGADFGSADVVVLDERERSLATDPVALGAIGALTIGVAAAALFAVVGFIVSASVAARERLAEFALLRAIGLSPWQLSGWLSLENAALALISLAAGSGLGAAMAWVALPFVTVTQRAIAPYPPVDVSVPWTTILVLDAVGLVALAITVAALAWLLRRMGMAASLRTGEG